MTLIVILRTLSGHRGPSSASFEDVFRGFALATMPHNGFDVVASTSIVQEAGVTIHLLLQTNAPKWCGAPFVATSQSAAIVIV